MKRQQNRDSSPKNKRSRSSMTRTDDHVRDCVSPENDRREGRTGKINTNIGRTHGTKIHNHEAERAQKHARDDRGIAEPLSRNIKSDRAIPYRILRAKNLSTKGSDNAVKEALFREFKVFGEVRIRVTREGSERLAYLYFRHSENAREACQTKSRILISDKHVQIEPIHGNRSVSPELPYSNRIDSGSPARSTSSRRSEPTTLFREVMPRGSERDRDFHQDSNRREFPSYLHHVAPEDDQKATRTLFVGNLDYNITKEKLRPLFDQYGMVEDIDVKRPSLGQGNAYAFVKFLNLDMAHRAKVEMSGQYIGNFQCKIGYGKATPTTRLWVGGLGPGTSLATLEREFDRFGVIKKIDYVRGDNYAYVLYASLDAAQAACQEMRGFLIEGSNRRLRVDFADTNSFPTYQNISPRSFNRDDDFLPRRSDRDPLGRDLRDMSHESIYYRSREREGSQWHSNAGFDPIYDAHINRGRTHKRGEWISPERNRNVGHQLDPHDWDRDRRSRRDNFEVVINRRKHPLDTYANEPASSERGHKYIRLSQTPERRSRDRTPSSLRGNRSPLREKFHDSRDHSSLGSYTKGSRNSQTSDDVSEHSEKDIARTRESNTEKSRDIERGKGKEILPSNQVRTIQELAKCYPVAWHGALVLKNSAFITRMHLISGDRTIVETLMRDSSSETSSLRISQRLRLDQPKLEDVSARMSTSGPSGHCLLIALPGTSVTTDDTTSTQQRPLRNLVSYLKQKEAAGVIALPVNLPKEKNNIGVLYAFPPCHFSHELLLHTAPNLGAEPSKEDHLVIAVVRGLS